MTYEENKKELKKAMAAQAAILNPATIQQMHKQALAKLKVQQQKKA